MNTLEKSARTLWLAKADDRRHGACHTCGRTHNDDGRPLVVAHHPRSRRGYVCLACFEERAS